MLLCFLRNQRGISTSADISVLTSVFWELLNSSNPGGVGIPLSLFISRGMKFCRLCVGSQLVLLRMISLLHSRHTLAVQWISFLSKIVACLADSAKHARQKRCLDSLVFLATAAVRVAVGADR